MMLPDWAAFVIGSSRLALYAEFDALSVSAGLPYFSANKIGEMQMMFRYSIVSLRDEADAVRIIERMAGIGRIDEIIEDVP